MHQRAGLSESLEAHHATKMLVFLLRNGPASKEDIQRALGASPQAVMDRTEELLQVGLIMQKVERRGIRKIQAHVISLTPPGKQVAELLSRVDEIVTRAKKTVEVK
jgi:predicted transcriptional regulator